MTNVFRSISTMLAAAAMSLSSVQAATPEQDAAEAAQAWAKAIVAGDVDAQMKLLPGTMYSKPGERERQRMQRLRDKEVRMVKGEKYLSFDVRASSQTVKINKMTAVVLPYQSVVTIAEGKLQTDSALIALAEEGSNKWSVFDGTGQNPRSLKEIIPGYTAGLIVPRAAAKVIKDQ